MTIRALIVDDEPLARQGLRDYLEAEDDVAVIGECGNGRDAVTAIRSDRPDLVLLDIQMPETDGFDVIGALGAEMPAVVFVTAHDEYALRAFDVHALDYLLKPVERTRFREALSRVRSRLAASDAAVDERLTALLDHLERRPRHPERLVVKSAGRVTFVPVADVDWIEAAGNYARVHARGRQHLIRETMTNLEARLDPRRFARIHRSTIVALDKVREIQPYFKGDAIVILDGGEKLTLSRTYRENVQRQLGASL